MFKFDSLNVIGFDEAPAGDGTACVGKVLGIEFFLFVKTGSANHKNKYKTILSKAPLEGAEEPELTGCGWSHATAVRAITKIKGVSFAFYSLHIRRSGARDVPAHSLATQVLPHEKKESYRCWRIQQQHRRCWN